MSISMWLLFSLNALSLEQINLIERGYECCYAQEVIDGVQQPIDNHQSTKINLDLHTVKEPAFKLNWTWTVFIGLQILDVYTTDSVLKYECVQELNPVLGKKPSLSKLIAVKLALFYAVNKYYAPIKDSDLVASNFLLAAAVANNFNVWNKAKSKC
jgi:hypothetical protein